MLAACGRQSYRPEPISPQLVAQQSQDRNHNEPAFKAYLEQHRYQLQSWPLERFDLAALTLAASYFNPTLQLARSRIEVARAGELIAGQKPNPTLNFPDEPRDTADFYGLIIDFIFERKAKRQARQARARANREAAEFQLAQQAWTIYTKLHANLIEYYAASQTAKLLKIQRGIVEDSLHLLEQRLAVGQTSEFELSSLRLELQQIELSLSNQRYLNNDALHRLVMDTGLQADKFADEDFVFSDLQLHLRSDSLEIKRLQADLLHSRFDIKKKLAEYEASEAKLNLEVEKRYPDVTLSPGLLFEEGQALWVLAAAGKIPLFHNNDGQIQQALALRKQKQHEFIQLQSLLMNELGRKKQNYEDRLAAYDVSRKLFAAVRARGEEIEKQFELGYSDQLSVFRARLEIEKARQAMFQIELDVMREAVRLEAVIQSPRHTSIREFDFMQTQLLRESE